MGGAGQKGKIGEWFFLSFHEKVQLELRGDGELTPRGGSRYGEKSSGFENIWIYSQQKVLRGRIWENEWGWNWFWDFGLSNWRDEITIQENEQISERSKFDKVDQ